MRGFPSNFFPPRYPALSAALSGLLLAAAFPPFSLAAASVVALIPLFVALHRGTYGPRVFFKTGYMFGFVFFGAHLWWIVHLSPASSITMPWLMLPATVLLVAYLALYPALWIWLVGCVGRGRGLAFVFLAPSLWVLVEWVRSTGVLGFPWGSIGYATALHPSMMQAAAIGGVLGLGALLVFVNALWSGALLARGLGPKALLLMAGFAVFLSNVVGGRIAIDRFDAAERGERSTVVLAQPDVDLEIKWEPEYTDSIFKLIAKLTREAAAFHPGLVVFPETAAPVYMRHNPTYRTFVRQLVDSLDTAVFLGFLDGRYDGPAGALNIYNSSGLFRPNGVIVQYDKVHLLPFGEAIPWGWKYRAMQKVDFGQANFNPGPERPPIPSPVGNLAPLICFESTFPAAPRRAAAQGADVLVNITNDGWFGDTPGPRQHADMAILRAVETRRFLIRSANTGITMFVDPVGRIACRLPMDEEAVLPGEIYRVEEKTVYTRYGDLPVLALSVAFVLFGVVTGLRVPRARFRGAK